MDERSRIQTLFIALTVLPASAYRKATARRTERFCVVVNWWGGFGGGEGGQEKSAILRRSTFM